MNGVNKAVHYLATEQHGSGCDVEVWGITATPENISHEHKYPLRLFQISRFRFRLTQKLRDALLSLPQETVVHLHSVFTPEFYVSSCLLRKVKVPWVVTPQGGYSPESMKKNAFAKKIYAAVFESRLISEAKAIHIVGASEVEDIKRLAIPKRIALIPNGQNLDDFCYSPISRSNNDQPVFGFCGRLAAQHKGLDLLIDGFAIYRKRGGAGNLWLIGSGPDEKALRARAERFDLAGKVEFIGPLFGSEKIKRISQMDIFVHTSRWEGLPTAVLEAAGLSKPLLISTATNLADYVNRWRCGFVLEKNTPQHIADALSVIATKHQTGELRFLGKNANSMISRDFQWSSIANRIFREAYLGDC